MDRELINLLKTQSEEMANEGHAGWGNTMTEALEALYMAYDLRDACRDFLRYDSVDRAKTNDAVSRIHNIVGVWISREQNKESTQSEEMANEDYHGGGHVWAPTVGKLFKVADGKFEECGDE